MMEGANSVVLPGGYREEGEMKENKGHGKSTINHRVPLSNKITDNGENKSYKEFNNRNEAFYINGKPHQALAPNWADFI